MTDLFEKTQEFAVNDEIQIPSFKISLVGGVGPESKSTRVVVEDTKGDEWINQFDGDSAYALAHTLSDGGSLEVKGVEYFPVGNRFENGNAVAKNGERFIIPGLWEKIAEASSEAGVSLTLKAPGGETQMYVRICSIQIQ